MLKGDYPEHDMNKVFDMVYQTIEAGGTDGGARTGSQKAGTGSPFEDVSQKDGKQRGAGSCDRRDGGTC